MKRTANRPAVLPVTRPAAGGHPKVIQRVMRHGTVTLTMDRYTHVFKGDEAAAATPDHIGPHRINAASHHPIPVDSDVDETLKKQETRSD